MSDSVRPHRWRPTRLPPPWDSPGKNTGVGYHFLLQCMKGKSESEVAQSCPTLRDPMVCSLPGSSVHGIFQARVLEWGAIAFSISNIKDIHIALWPPKSIIIIIFILKLKLYLLNNKSPFRLCLELIFIFSVFMIVTTLWHVSEIIQFIFMWLAYCT